MICDCLCTRKARFTGFDDIRFAILAENDSPLMADWTIEPITVVRHVPGSNRSVVQHVGVKPATVAWRLYFDCRHHYHAMLARLATTGTLTVIANTQSLAGTQVTMIDGTVYEQLYNTRLMGLTDVKHALGRGGVYATATFARAIDPVTRREAT